MIWSCHPVLRHGIQDFKMDPGYFYKAQNSGMTNPGLFQKPIYSGTTQYTNVAIKNSAVFHKYASGTPA